MVIYIWNMLNLLVHGETTFRSLGKRGYEPGPLFIKGTNVLPQDLEASLEAARDLCLDASIALKFNRYLGSAAAEMPAKLESNTKVITSNLAVLRLHEILH